MIDADVTYSVEVVFDESPVQGDPDGNPDYHKWKAEVLQRLEREDTSAWCGVVVTAKHDGVEGHASLWGITFPADDGATGDTLRHAAEQYAHDNDLMSAAHDDLLDELKKHELAKHAERNAQIVAEIMGALWADGPDTEWSSDTASDIANILNHHGITAEGV